MCNFCNEPYKPIYDINNNSIWLEDGNELYFANTDNPDCLLGEIKIQHCPMCGKRLSKHSTDRRMNGII